ncbi:iap1 [Cyclophragma undans nucleopolyhedrovirus]|uniref:Iap1 n=1 Tax=Cyclophragma undans nucleopolyhedrovirus TaxID=1906244 RepID=A0A288QW30_9ABAC|nr:iap1 [Cyclophragma undans nucleopolyhedrovirus]AOT85579.1 iap1 [Cyclophragma undans nucleopolyhedrovirus]
MNDADAQIFAPVYLINVCETMQHNIEHLFETLVDRHNSFENYPINDTEFINNLIVNGFKYNQIDDHVVCQYCDVEIGNWSANDRIEYVHAALSPHCLYARKAVQHSDASAPPFDTIEAIAAAVAPCPTKTILIKRGKIKCMYSCMSNVQARVNTFADHWPAVLRGLVTDIADAGLFYNGRGDETVCFFCDCRVHEWHAGDDAWRRHALANSQCYFLVSVKGAEFCNNLNIAVSTNFKNEDDSGGDDDDDADNNNDSKRVDDATYHVCTVCWERQRDAVLLPCRHFCICVQCYFGLRDKCPTCRQEVVDFIKVFVT